MYLHILIAFCEVLGLTALRVEKCGISTLNEESRIVGGKHAKHGYYPWVVALFENDPNDPNSDFEFGCGGTILSENWILTAAHCVEMPTTPQNYKIYAGIHKVSNHLRLKGRAYKISKIIVHEDYDDDYYINDIALLKTRKPIDFAKSEGCVNAICLPVPNTYPSGNAIVVGYGHEREDGVDSDTLKEVEVPIVSRTVCNELYDEEPLDEADEILDTMLCAGAKGKDSCQNDSGGPIFQTDRDGVSTIIGIVSHGAGCGMKNFPGIYTNVAKYITWINEKTGNSF